MADSKAAVAWAFGLALAVTPAAAQSTDPYNFNPYHFQRYTIQTPGQPPTYVNPNPAGSGYIMQTPGGPPTYITPRPFGGGYDVKTPGQPPTFVNPN